MIVLISPAKSINFKPVRDGVAKTHSPFEEQAQLLVTHIMQTHDIARTLDVSQALGELNEERFTKWHTQALTPEGERAAWVYRGETYFGLSAENLTDAQLAFADSHLRIVSGLYGLLRATDVIMPYRLEMKTKLKGDWGKNLYDFWGDSLASSILKTNPTFVLNCASQEYAKALTPHLPQNLPVITPKFLHDGPSGLKPKMAFAKYSRGLMARWAITQEISSPDELQAFDIEGYKYSAELSTDNEPVFIAPAGFTIKGRFKKT